MVRGRISRRRLLQSFSIAAVALPGASFAQQGGSGRPASPARHDAARAAVRGDRLEDGLARPPHLSVRRLQEGGGVLRDADGLEGSQRRWQAGGARHRRELGRHHHPRRVDGAAAGRDHRRRARRQPAAGAGGVRRLRVGHRAVGHRQGEGGAREARAATRSPITTVGLRASASRIPTASMSRSRTAPRRCVGRRRRTRSCRRRRRSSRPAGTRSTSITSRSRCPTSAAARRSTRRCSAGRCVRATATQASVQIGDIGGAIIRGNAAARAARARHGGDAAAAARHRRRRRTA